MLDEINYARSLGAQALPNTQHRAPTQSPILSYPVEAFPPLLQDVIRALHTDTQIPIELIGNAVLTAASLACQSHVEVIQSHMTTAEPCSLFLLTLAESGEGKSTINKKVMEPFYTFSETMKQEYQEHFADYKRKHKLWKIRERVFTKRLQKAIEKDFDDQEDAEEQLEAHNLIEPIKPHCLNMLYEDATPKTLIQGLSEYPVAGLLSDEAIIFFKGYTKNNLGLLNKTWDGGTYSYRRPDGETHDIKACLTLSLMVQPNVFNDYLEKNGDIAKGSGFLSRVLFANPISTISRRHGNGDHRDSSRALKTLHDRIIQLLEKQRADFYNTPTEKRALALCDEAVALQRQQRAETERKMVEGQEWAHIRDIASKAGANTLRLAAILTFIQDNENTQISAETLEGALKIINWHLHQASLLFYPMSERYHFEQDVYALFAWLKNKFLQGNASPIQINYVERFGPNRLRRIEKLKPVLEQLIGMGLVCLIRANLNSAVFIAMPARPPSSGWYIPQAFYANGWNPIIATQQNVRGKYDAGYFNQSRLLY
ncbi:YfjI family protein [Serratia liquefaciens]|uniref:YfjI family protein n=1 Tax=Serratia TaxID=613 RepID=UPI0013EC2BA5|nr:YfjI family protein [Serratia liquefaciens]